MAYVLEFTHALHLEKQDCTWSVPTKNSHLHKIVTILAETSFKLLQDVPLTAISDFMLAFIVTRSTLDLNYSRTF